MTLREPPQTFVCHACRNALRPRPLQQLRRFSSTPYLDNRSLPRFTSASSSELDALLSDIRYKYFLPYYLNKQQRKLIQSKKLSAQLEVDPMYATIGDEEIQLRHIDVTKDVPARSAFLEVVRLSQEKGDWSNVPALLEGYHHCKKKLDPEWLGRMIDASEQEGTMGAVLLCIQQVKRNGFSLSIREVREHTLLGIRATARRRGWSDESLEAGLKHAEAVLNEMERPEHCGSRTVTVEDARAEPYVAAIPLELAARAALQGADGMVAKAKTYSTRLLAALAQQKSALTDDGAWRLPQGLEKRYQVVRAVRSLDMLMSKFLAVRNALGCALRISGLSWSGNEKKVAERYIEQIGRRLQSAATDLSQEGNVSMDGLSTPGLDEYRQKAS